MHIRFQMEGGLAHFPGLNAPFTIDTTTLPAQERQEIERLVNAARFFSRPMSIGSSVGKADQRTYIISVQENGRSHTVRAVEPVEDAPLQSLIDELRGKQREQRSRSSNEPHSQI